jgi:hypothetical protein
MSVEQACVSVIDSRDDPVTDSSQPHIRPKGLDRRPIVMGRDQCGIIVM